MASTRFIILNRRLSELERHYIRKIDPANFSTNRNQDLLRGYRCLVHAEFEAFLEERAKEAVLRALMQWERRQKPSKVITSLLAFSEQRLNCISNCIKNNDQKNLDLTDRIKIFVSTYINYLVHNHGIKEENVLNILLPIGVSRNEIDSTWLNTINSYGEERGKVAHSSGNVLKTIDPGTEKTTIDLLKNGIIDLDKVISSLK